MSLLPTIKDSRGRESHTLLFVTLAALVLIYKFAVASLTLFGITFPAMTATEFGIAFGAVLAVWLARDWTEKTASK
jgi:membrane associated rhomboid family serine protease